MTVYSLPSMGKAYLYFEKALPEVSVLASWFFKRLSPPRHHSSHILVTLLSDHRSRAWLGLVCTEWICTYAEKNSKPNLSGKYHSGIWLDDAEMGQMSCLQMLLAYRFLLSANSLPQSSLSFLYVRCHSHFLSCYHYKHNYKQIIISIACESLRSESPHVKPND